MFGGLQEKIHKFLGSKVQGSRFIGLGIRASRYDPTRRVQGSARPLTARAASLIEKKPTNIEHPTSKHGNKSGYV
jgi:hypothetical protein